MVELRSLLWSPLQAHREAVKSPDKLLECDSTQSIDISFSLLIAVVWLGLYFVLLLVCSFLRMIAIEMWCCFGGIV